MRKGRSGASWSQGEPGPELALIRAHAPSPAAIIDVGSGRTGLIGALVAEGFADVTALDVSVEAMARARARLAAAADGVAWIAADVTAWEPARTYDLWHDRAVLHFLILPPQRDAYRRTLMRATRPGSVAILSTFAPDGPERCSGLAVRRYGQAEMAAFLGLDFETLAIARTDHRTPWGAVQPFHTQVARRRAP